MVRKIIDRIKYFFEKGDIRSIKAKKNIVFSFLLKFISIAVSFVLVPLTLNYLGVEEYGIWLALSSILGWLGYFDIGLGNGLRNKLTECIATKDLKMARIYVSTTYASVFLIFTAVILVFMAINPFLNWVHILNTSPAIAHELNLLVFFVATFLYFRFITQLISTVLVADQNPSISNTFDVLSNVISLAFLFILKAISFKSIVLLGIIFSASPVLIFVIASVYFYNGKYAYIRPSIKFVQLKYFKVLGGLGIKFFFIQLSFLLTFSINTFFTSYLYGPSQVTPYSIAYKYFYTAFMVYSIILYPFWSAFTDAYIRKDINWIKTTLQKLIKLWLLMSIGVIIMIIFSSFMYNLWVGSLVKIPFSVSLLMGVFMILFAWFNTFCFFINGTGKITLQLIVYILAAILNVILILFFGKILKLGITGIVLANILAIIPLVIFMPLQTYKIIAGKTTGIWNK